MYALRLRTPNSNPRIFVKAVHPSMRYIIVPKRFHDAVGHEINDIVQLCDPAGNTFNFSYHLDITGDYRMGPGLSNIRSVHQIHNTVMMHFIYRGKSIFGIHIFDPFGREITYNFTPQLAPQIFDNFADAEYNHVINTSSDEEGNDEPEAPWMEKIWETHISAAQIYDGLIVTISSEIQQTYFKDLPPFINVLLPHNTIAQWHIQWNPTVLASGSGGWIGELAAGWCDFYMNGIINHDNYDRLHRIELWESSQSESYIVHVYEVLF